MIILHCEVYVAAYVLNNLSMNLRESNRSNNADIVRCIHRPVSLSDISYQDIH